jgi:hypothetical protein
MVFDQESLKEDIIKTFDLEQVPEDQRDKLIGKISLTLIRRIFIETMEKLGDQGVADYEALMDRSASQEEIETFLESRIPGYTVFVEDVVTAFKAELLERAA